MGKVVAHSVMRAWPEVDFDGVVPVPSPFLRRMRRGFAPAELIASAAGRSLCLPLLPALSLSKAPRPQKGLSEAQRRKNLRGVFQATKGAVRGKRLLLVDDVITTGTTLRAASAALHRAGAEVYAATFATTLRRDMDLYTAEEGEAAGE